MTATDPHADAAIDVDHIDLDQLDQFDFDIFDPEFVRDPYPTYSKLRSGCPVAHTDNWGGQWMPTRYADVDAITHDTDHFSSVTGAVAGRKPGEGPLLIAPPITADPPEHGPSRRLLLPAFSPKEVDKLTPVTRSIARKLIADITARGADENGEIRADAAIDYAQHIPVLVIAGILGVPLEDEALFTDWVVRILKIGPTDEDVLREAMKELFAYFSELIEQRRDDPSPPQDLLQYLITVEFNGAPLERKHLLGVCFLILLAGIDTTWSSIGSSLWHLAGHPGDRERLVAEPELIPTAIEEFLRAYSPVTMARIVKDEVELGGRTLCPGERVLLPFPAANRDPEVFDRPDEVVIDRAVNRHAAFGLGIHRCLGSNLARMELRVGIEEWLAAFPTFRLDPSGEVRWNGGQVRGPNQAPVIIG